MENIADTDENDGVIANIKINERRGNIKAPRRIDLPGQIVGSNALHIERPGKNHDQRRCAGDAKIQRPASTQNAIDQRIIRAAPFPGKNDALLLEIHSPAPGISHTMTQSRRKATVQELNHAADTDKNIPKP